MGLEYRTGYCQNCQADRKLERKKPNHILHLLITVVLGIFTYGIGSVIWIAVWFFLSLKVSSWTCHVCGNVNEESNTHDKEQKNNQSNLMINLRKYSTLIIGLVLTIAIVVILFSFDIFDNKESKKSKKKQDTKENVVNAKVDVQEKDTAKNNNTLKYSEIESGLCYLYDIKKSSDTVSGFVSCEEGKLTITFYDSDTKENIETKTVDFKDNKFSVKLNSLGNKDFKIGIKLTKEQISKQKKKMKENGIQSISSVQSSNEDENTKAVQKCTITSWKYSKYSSEYLVVDGKTSCTNGKIVLQIFDENKNNLGKQTDQVESGVFSIFFKTSSNPKGISLNYTISQ